MAAVLVRHCPQPPSLLLWTPAPHRPLIRPLPCSASLHCGFSWWLEMEDWPSQTILATNSGGWPATNEPRTGDVEAACSGHIVMAETHSNGYVYTTSSWWRMADNFHCRLKLPGASSASQPGLPSRRDFSAVRVTYHCDARSRLLPKTNEAAKLDHSLMR